MSTKQLAPPKVIELDWEQVARALFASLGIDEGFWHLGVQVNFGATTAGWGDPEKAMALPTGLVGMKGIGLNPAQGPGPMVFDASAPVRKPGASRPSMRPVKPVAKRAKVVVRG